ncbi:hypothetical protein [Gordonia phthalatica]|uniref:Uncharacterized protein n=1 Tax=Gordonia phthalatica TaxID=1136941 RepID=A0A0N7FUG7_9ACTN|nr:hypothetical protein [Gordonia phthalatica]ALG84311.1 hypothetical protein ACH46_07100 [Gordonia phthalatica]
MNDSSRWATIVAAALAAAAGALGVWGMTSLSSALVIGPGLIALGVATMIVVAIVGTAVAPAVWVDRRRERVADRRFYLLYIGVLMALATVVVGGFAVARLTILRIFDDEGATVLLLCAGTAASCSALAAACVDRPSPRWSSGAVVGTLVVAVVVSAGAGVGSKHFGMTWKSGHTELVMRPAIAGGVDTVTYRKAVGDSPVQFLRNVIAVAEEERLAAYSGVTGELAWWASFPMASVRPRDVRLHAADPMRENLILTTRDVDFTIDGRTGALISRVRSADTVKSSRRAVVGADGQLFVAGNERGRRWHVRLTSPEGAIVDDFELPDGRGSVGGGPVFAHRLPGNRLLAAADGATNLFIRDREAKTVSSIEPNYHPLLLGEDTVTAIGDRIVVSDGPVLTEIDPSAARVVRRVDSPCPHAFRVVTVANRVVVECPTIRQWIGFQ